MCSIGSRLYIDTLPCDEDYFPAFSFTEVSLGEVLLVIRHSTSQARSHGGIPQSVILAASPILGPLIINSFNGSLKNSIFPSIWKKSLVIAFHKTSSSRTMIDVRPISLLYFYPRFLSELFIYNCSTI